MKWDVGKRKIITGRRQNEDILLNPQLTARILMRREAAGPDRNKFRQEPYWGWSVSRVFPALDGKQMQVSIHQLSCKKNTSTYAQKKKINYKK